MLGMLFGLVFGHPNLTIGLVVVALGAAVVLTQGAILTHLAKPRVLIAIAAAVGVLSFVSMKNENAKLREENRAVAVRLQTVEDGQKAVQFKVERQAQARVKANRISQAINNAPTGKKTDAALDEIAHQDEQANPTPQPKQPDSAGSSPRSGALDWLLDRPVGEVRP